MKKQTASYLAANAQVDRRQTICAPARHEGIGNALRAAFDHGSYGLPDEFARLLSKLDR